MSEDTKKIIYSMVGVSKHYNKQPIIKDISLSYFYGAKIGVLGLNGSGKSTLLRIMAGVDKEFNGQTILSEGYTIGFLEQEPLVDCAKTVREVVEEGVQETVDLLKEFEQINNAFADPDADMEKLCERQAVVQDQLDALDAWDLDSRLDLAMDALRCPPGETSVKVLSGGEKRRVALCRLLLQKPDILLLDEPTNHLDAETVAWLEQHLQRYAGTVIAVTHDRYFLDNVAGWILELDRGHGIPWKGNYSSWLEQKQERLRREEKAESQRQKTLQHELEWMRMSPKARHAKGQARISAYEKLLNQERGQRERELEIYIPAGPRLGGVVIEANGVSQGLRRPAALRQPELQPPPRRHRRHHRPQRRRQDHPVPPDHRPGAARRRQLQDRRDGEAGLRRSGARPRPGQDHVGGDHRRPGADPARQAAGQLARLRGALQLLRDRTSRRRSGSSPAASATACTWPRCCARRPTSCSSTSRPTTSTSTPCARWKRGWRTSPAARW